MNDQHFSHDQIHELLAAYAVNAVSRDEALAIEQHLAICEICRHEASEMHFSAALLGTSAQDAPPIIWERIQQQIEGPTELPRLSAPQKIKHKKRFVTAGASIAAALLAAVSVTALVGQHKDPQDREVAAAKAASAQPDAQAIEMRSADGKLHIKAVVLPSGRSYLWNGDLPPAQTGHTYQLWAFSGTTPVSMGVFDTTDKVAVFTVTGSYNGMAVTEEPAGGAVTPTTPPIVSSAIPA